MTSSRYCFRALRTVLLLAVASASQGCQALSNFEAALEDAGLARFEATREGSGRSVGTAKNPSRGGERGNAAVIDESHVLTVAHVVGTDGTAWISTTKDGGWVRAREALRIPASPEPLVLLELEVAGGLAGLFGFSGFSQGDHFEPGAGAPTHLRSARGTYRLNGAALKPGDSGSAVLNSTGQLVGVLSGRRGQEAVWIELPPELSGSQDLGLLACLTQGTSKSPCTLSE